MKKKVSLIGQKMESVFVYYPIQIAKDLIEGKEVSNGARDHIFKHMAGFAMLNKLENKSKIFKINQKEKILSDQQHQLETKNESF